MKKIHFSNAETANICREVVYLLHAGVGNADALLKIAEDETRPEYKKIFEEMGRKADQGATLSEVFKDSGCFDTYICEMLHVGEESGRTESALESLAKSCENRARLDAGMRSALLYPMILLLIMLLVIAVLLIYILPIFNDVYAQLGANFTGVAGGLLSIGKGMKSVGGVLIAVFSVVTLFLCFFAGSTSFRESILNVFWSRKSEKGIGAKIRNARFAQALSLGMSSGLGAVEAIEMASKVISDSANTQDKLKKCQKLLENNNSISASLRESGLLPASHCRMLEAGIKGGSGELAMDQIASRLTEDSDIALEQSIGRIEPTMVIIACVLVGLILISVMLPLINILEAIG